MIWYCRCAAHANCTRTHSYYLADFTHVGRSIENYQRCGNYYFLMLATMLADFVVGYEFNCYQCRLELIVLFFWFPVVCRVVLYRCSMSLHFAKHWFVFVRQRFSGAEICYSLFPQHGSSVLYERSICECSSTFTNRKTSPIAYEKELRKQLNIGFEGKSIVRRRPNCLPTRKCARVHTSISMV